MTSFFPQKMVPEPKPEWNQEAITIFTRLPSLWRLQATPPLQTSLYIECSKTQKCLKPKSNPKISETRTQLKNRGFQVLGLKPQICPKPELLGF